MRILIGVENNNEGRSVAWTLEHFGCIAVAPDGETAVIRMAQAIPAYMDWMASHTPAPWFNPEEIEIRLVEVVNDYRVDDTFQIVDQGGRLIKAWFRTDWRPVTSEDAERALQILSWNRQDILRLIAPLSDEELDRSFEPGEWTIREILGHVGRSEWWLLDRLGRAHEENLLSTDPLERFMQERAFTINAIPDLIDIEQVVGNQGEFWSPRKMLRRLCWHERDHVNQIMRYLGYQQVSSE